MINYDQLIENIIRNPSESLHIELKPWIDPDENEGKAKIVKCCLAMFNHNGGILAIGFDKNGKILPYGEKVDRNNVHQLYGSDKIQPLIKKHSSFNFNIDINGKK